MRIISGIYKGRKLQAVPSTHTRPTTDRVREAWASTLISLVPKGSLKGVRILDPFAGSGALGLELLSRGASECVFVEKGKAAIKTLKANIASLDLTEKQASVCIGDSLTAKLPARLPQGKPFEVVVLDPPYALTLTQVKGFLGRLAERELIVNQTLVSYEHAAKDAEDLNGAILGTGGTPLSLYLVRSKTYGTICLDYYLCL